MKTRLWLAMVLCVMLSSNALAQTSVVGLHIGVNHAPIGSGQKKLRYADDDAVRFFNFVSTFSKKTFVHTTLDAESQRRYANLVHHTRPPTRRALKKTIVEIFHHIQAESRAGRRVTVYFSYSGHGVTHNKMTLLTVLDGFLSRSWLETQIMRLPAHAIHLFVDACHTEGLITSRGVFAKEVNARSRKLTTQERQVLLEDDLLVRYPNVGALLATSEESVTLEWSRLQAGLFTHELLSALAGAADVNADGKIAYSEVAAFISAANTNVSDERTTPNVISHPPRQDHNQPILSMDWIKDPTRLQGVISHSIHLYLENSDGVRILDVHPEPGRYLSLLVPASEKLWLKTKRSEKEVAFRVDPGDDISFSQLELRSGNETTGRGSMSQALDAGLFSSPFGPLYYRGWVDQRHVVPVNLRFVQSIDTRAQPESSGPAITCFIGAGLSLAASIAFSAYAIDAKDYFNEAKTEREAKRAQDRYRFLTGMAFGGVALSAVLTVAGVLWWPEYKVHLDIGLTRQDAHLSMGLRF